MSLPLNLPSVTKGVDVKHSEKGIRCKFEGFRDGKITLTTGDGSNLSVSKADELKWMVVAPEHTTNMQSGSILQNQTSGQEAIYLYQVIRGIAVRYFSDPWKSAALIEIDALDEWVLTPETLASRNQREAVQKNRQISELEEEKKRVERENIEARKLSKIEESANREEEYRRYLQQRKEDAQKREWLEQQAKQKKKQEWESVQAVWSELNTNFPMAQSYFQENHSHVLSKHQFDKEAAKFVVEWFRLNFPDEPLPDIDQARAIASDRQSQLLVARAGSGKTSTLVKRIIFWTQHCRVDPREILVLAFNSKAASEVEDRYRAFLKLGSHDPVPHIMTFHAMAVAFSPDIKVESQPEGQLQHILLNLVKEDYFDQFRTIMRSYFSADLKFYEQNRLDLPSAEALRMRREVLDVALAGHETKSYGEHLIANQLFEYGIPYSYERIHRWGGRPYRPDFTIFFGEGKGIIIEYYGMFADETNSEYRKQIEEKRSYWEKRDGWELLEYYPHDILKDPEPFKARILADLARLKPDLALEKLSDEEIWRRIESRALSEFTNVSATVIGRFRKSGLKPDDIETKLMTYQETFEHESKFIKIVNEAYRRYLSTLDASGHDDFDGFVERASDSLAKGVSVFERRTGVCEIKNLKQIYIDEFQDFTFLFANMLEKTLNIARDSQLFCVGDDWQAINGFAGSDLQYFYEFEQNFSDAQTLTCTTNYRSHKHVVEFGNAVMHGLGDLALVSLNAPDSGFVKSVDLSELDLHPVDRERTSGEDLIAVILRIFNDVISSNKDGDLVLLSRTKSVPSMFGYVSDGERSTTITNDIFLRKLKKFIPEELHDRIDISTAHGYKGKEAHTIVVLDAFQRRYPLLHPRLKFSRFSGLSEDSQSDEERRLFYVAVTRAKNQLIVITDSNRTSRFYKAASRIKPVERLDIDSLPQWSYESANALVVLSTVNGFDGTFVVRDEIKASGYRWHESRCKSKQGWTRKVDKLEFDIRALESEPWFGSAHGVIARVIDCGSARVLIRKHIYDGNWE